MNLRKDHYRKTGQDSLCLSRPRPRRRWRAGAPAQLLLSFLRQQPRRGRQRVGRAIAPSPRAGPRRAQPLVSGRLSPRGLYLAPQERRTPGGTVPTHRAPAPALGPASRVPTTRPRSPGARRGAQCPRRGIYLSRSRGARSSFAPETKYRTVVLKAPAQTNQKPKSTTLSGGSLGSCVDEERS